MVTWTIKNEIKKNPVKAITNFRPMDEVKKDFQVINRDSIEYIFAQRYKIRPKKRIVYIDICKRKQNFCLFKKYYL